MKPFKVFLTAWIIWYECVPLNYSALFCTGTPISKLETLKISLTGCHIKLIHSSQIESSNIFDNRFTLSIDNENYLLKENNSYLETRRFALCFVHWYTVPQKKKTYPGKRIRLKLQMHKEAEEFPNYYVFFEAKNIAKRRFKHNKPMNIFFTSEITDLSMVSPIILISKVDRVSDVWMICTICYNNMFVSMDLIAWKGKSLYTIWKNLNMDQSGLQVLTAKPSSNYTVANFRQCTGFAGNLALFSYFDEIPDWQLCVHELLKSRLNYTTNAEDKSTFLPHFAILGLQISGSRSQVSRESRWLPYTVNERQLQAVIMLTKPNIDNAAIFKPLKLYAWINIFTLSIFLLVITKVSVILFDLGQKDLKYNNWTLVTGVLAAIIDQPATIFYKLLRERNNPSHRPFTIICCWWLWLMVGVGIGQVYKADIYSFLTKRADLDWPENASDIVEQPILLLTVSKTHRKNRNSSVIKDRVLNSVNNQLVPLPRAYSIMQEKIIQYKKSLVALCMEVNSSNFTRYGMVENHTQLAIPSANIAIIDFPEKVKRFKLLATLFNHKSSLSNLIEISGISVVSLWKVGSTQFLPIFQAFYSYYLESGIGLRTVQHLQSIRLYSNLKKVEKQLNRKTINLQLLHAATCGNCLKNQDNTTGPLNIEMLRMAFIIISISYILQFLCFTYEILT